jgi:hypothetical protein
MPPLTADQLDSIQRLLSEPLRQAVRTEMQAGNDRLASAIERVAQQLADHVADNLRRERAREGRLESLERRVVILENFRGRVLIVYAALTVALSFAWSVFRDWITGLSRKH